jgi:hypothetical protein
LTNDEQLQISPHAAPTHSFFRFITSSELTVDLLPSAPFLSVILSYSHYTVLKAVEITSTLSFTRFPAVIPSALRRVSSKVNWLAKLDTPLQDSLGTSMVKDLRTLLLKLFRKQAISLCQKKRLELEVAIRFYSRGSLLKSEA